MCGCLSGCILPEDIERNHDWHSKQVCYLDLLPEIAMATTCNQTQILEEKETEEETRFKNVLLYFN